MDVPHHGQLRVELPEEAVALTAEQFPLPTLAPKLRAVVVLRDIYDLPHDDIASELGISVSASKVRLHRARHQLRDELLPDIAVGSRDL